MEKLFGYGYPALLLKKFNASLQHFSFCLKFIYLLGFYLSTASLHANPEGGVVSAGEAQINYNQQPNYTEIVQHTEKAVIDWRKFDIAPQEHTNFKQPSSESITLNRIHSDESSNINGQLTANGKLILINQNGIMFDQNSKVDVNGILATTANIANDQFMRSEKLKEQQLLFESQGSAEASIVNKGAITAAKGLVGLVAPNVVNSGLIVAKAGKVTLASGDHFTLDLQGDALLDVGISEEVTSQILANTGQVIADGGEILLTAAAGKEIVNSLVVNTGVLSARSINRKNGEIIISAEGSNAVKNNIASDKGKKQGHSTVLINGVIDVSGEQEGESGGKLQITADEIGLMSGTLINASGHSGKAGIISKNDLEKSAKREGSAGGEILIGGDYLGQGEVPAAKYLYVHPEVLVLNDATDNGDAGRNIFWSDGITQFYGSVYARALGGKEASLENGNAVLGGNLGDGGFVETSGKGRLDALGNVDLTASNGEVGTYLLDPSSVNIYGNFDPTFTSTDGSINLSNNLRVWIDFSDQSKVNLIYRTVLSGVNDSPVYLTNNVIAENNVLNVNNASELSVGARIKIWTSPTAPTSFPVLPASFVEPNSGTNNTDIYTVIAISGNTLTVSPNLKINYTTNQSVYQGYINKIEGKASYTVNGVSYNVNGVVTNNLSYPVWISNAQNTLGVGSFRRAKEFISVKMQGADGVSEPSDPMVYLKSQLNYSYIISYNLTTPANFTSSDEWASLYTFGNHNTGTQFTTLDTMIPRCNAGGPGLDFLTQARLLSGAGVMSGYPDRTKNNNPHFVIHTYNLSSIVDPTYKYSTVSYTSIDGEDSWYPTYVPGGNIPDSRSKVLYKTTDPNTIPSIQSIVPSLHYLGASVLLGPNNKTIYYNSSIPADFFIKANIYEVIEYNVTLADDIRILIDQYQSVKWGIPFYRTKPATSYAVGVNGTSSLSTSYLRQASSSADVSIVGDNINLDLKNDNLNLINDKNLGITARTSLSVPSAGTITTTKTSAGGNITIQLDSGNADLKNLTLQANNGGQININATAGSVTVGTMNAGSILVKANGSTNDLIIPSGKRLTTTGSTNPLILVAGRNFINNNSAGTAVLTTAANTYWRIYMNKAGGNLGTDASYLGASSPKYSLTYNAGSIPNDASNLLIYATMVKGNLTIVPNTSSLSITYGDAAPNLSSISYTLTGYIAPDTYSSDVVTGQAAFSTNYTQGSSVGGYNLAINPGTLSSNLGYIFNTSNVSNFVQVNPKVLNVNLTGSISKEYDGTRNATLSANNYNLSGVISGDAISLNNPSFINYDTKSTGTNKNVTATGLSITGAKASNYILGATNATATIGTITTKALTASLTGQCTKQYDGNATAMLTLGNYLLSGKVSGDDVNVNNAAVSASYNNKVVGTNKNITATGLAIIGTDAGNYALGSTNIVGAIGEITPKALTASLTGAVAKEYDGTTNATLISSNYGLSGIVGEDVVSLSYANTGIYDTKAVGTNKNVTVTGLSIQGMDAGNYNLDNSTVTTAIGEITHKNVVVNLVGSINKVYDGTNTAILTPDNYHLSGLITGDDVSLNTPTIGFFDSKIVGNSKGVTVAGVAISGLDATNYNLTAN